MPEKTSRIAFGGGCHWCTEAIFQSLKGVIKVEQGYVSSSDGNSSFSEAVIVHFNSHCITLHTLIEIHLLTHKSRSKHTMRQKYRSAIYVFEDAQSKICEDMLEGFQMKYDYELITEVLAFIDFQPSRKEITNYYYNNPEKPFCKTYINPKLNVLLQQFSRFVDETKVGHLNRSLKD